MCGLIARFGPPCDPAELRLRIEAGLDAMAHRGPDGRGVWIGDGVALGHVRLAVTDLAGGAQPIANEDGSVVAIVNGELYNDCRDELLARGHRFRTRSDSELVVHLYEERGLDSELRGEYAFVLWDGRRLVAERDPFGIKPLVYAHHAGALWIASEAKALFAVGVPAVWDAGGVRQALAHQYLAPGRTLFRGIRELPAGHRLLVDCHSARELPPSTVREPDLADADVVPGIRAALDEAVAVRLRADVPIAAYLSGGLDSSLVVALAARRAPITAFGIAFDHADYDEHADAAAFARELGVAFHPVRVSQDAILESLPEAVYGSEGLCINGQLSAKFLLSRAVRDAGFKVVLAGEGADEVFFGYAHLVRDYLEVAAAGGDRVAAAQLVEHDCQHAPQAGVMLPLGRRRDLPTWLDAKREIGERMRPLLAPLGVPTDDPIAQLLACFGDAPGDAVARSAASWTRLALARYILRTLGDGTEMAHSVEGRLPFLDGRVVASARRASTEQHLRGGVAKRLLREAARGILPEQICARPKRPLLAPPIAQSLSKRSADLINDVVRGSSLPTFFDRARVIAWVDSLSTLSPVDGRAAEPIVMTILSACAMQQRFRLGAP